jgi:hypothetical protein
MSTFIRRLNLPAPSFEGRRREKCQGRDNILGSWEEVLNARMGNISSLVESGWLGVFEVIELPRAGDLGCSGYTPDETVNNTRQENRAEPLSDLRLGDLEMKMLFQDLHHPSL